MPTVPDMLPADAKNAARSGRGHTKRHGARGPTLHWRRNQEWVWRGWFFGTTSIAVPLALLADAPLPFPSWSLWACALSLIAVVCAFAAALTQHNLIQQQKLAQQRPAADEATPVPALRLTAALFLTLGFSYGTLACLIALRAGLTSMTAALCLAPLLPGLLSIWVWKREPVVPAALPNVALQAVETAVPETTAVPVPPPEVTDVAPNTDKEVLDIASQRDSMPTEPASRPTLTPSTRSPSVLPPVASDEFSGVRHSRMPTLPAPQSVAEQAALDSASDYEVVIPRSPRAPKFAPEVLPRNVLNAHDASAEYQPNLEPNFRPTQRDRGQKRAPLSSPSESTVSWNTTRTAEELDRELDQRFEALTSSPRAAVAADSTPQDSKAHPAPSPKPPLVLSLDSGERPIGRSQFEIAYNSKGGPGYVGPAELTNAESDERGDSSLPPDRESSGPPAPLESAIRWASSDAQPPSLEQGLLETLHNARRVPADAEALRAKAKTALH